MGNSEVGHINLGAGRIVSQPLVRINKAIDDKSYFENKVFLEALQNVKKWIRSKAFGSSNIIVNRNIFLETAIKRIPSYR